MDTLTQDTSGFVTLAEGTIASDYALKNLNKALGEAQAEFTPAVKSEENKWGGYKYTPLSEIVKACRPALVKHHLTVSQIPGVDLERKTAVIHTRVVHWDSGEWFQNSLELPGELALGKDGAPKFNQQTIGGTFTYIQKYAYKTNLGIPDSEEMIDEMIDSTEEKGDLPARSKGKQQRVEDRVAQASTQGYNERQKQAEAPQTQTSVRSQFLGKAKEYGWGLGDVKKLLKKANPEVNSTAEMTEEQLETTLRIMAQAKPEPFFAQLENADAEPYIGEKRLKPSGNAEPAQ